MDMLVRLYDVDFTGGELPEGVVLKRAIAPEKAIVCRWVREQFGDAWANECDVALSNQPSTCYVAVRDGQLLGFACFDATYRGFFGPTGVAAAWRGQGLGKALLLRCMETMWHCGYAYAVIGDPGPTEFYRRLLDAVPIPQSDGGVYRHMLHT